MDNINSAENGNIVKPQNLFIRFCMAYPAYDREDARESKKRGSGKVRKARGSSRGKRAQIS